MPTIEYTPHGRDGYSCVLRSSSGDELGVTAQVDSDGLPEYHGSGPFRENKTVVANLTAFGAHEAQYRRLRAAEKRKSHKSQAAHHRGETLAVAGMVGNLGDSIVTGWCSGCFGQTDHRHVRSMRRPTVTYLCGDCGAPTTPCAVPGCKNLANRGARRATTPRYCAEHRHDIPSFEKMTARLSAIDDYEDWLAFEKRNAARITKAAGPAVVAGITMMPAALAAAPAIGGATGAFTGLSGAAATSHGLAMWGGGSLAAGGLGMAGGTTVLTALGSGLGSAVGGAVARAYVSADDSFGIKKLRDGDGPAVLFATGFLTEGKDGWDGWRPAIDARYPDNPVYQVHWGAKERKALTHLLGGVAGKGATATWIGKKAVKASKKVSLGPLAPLLTASGVAANPWSVARSRAEMTGATLADIIVRTEGQTFILMGHSLGARVMVVAAQVLGSREASPRIESMHLLGAAVGSDGNWRTLSDAVEGTVWNYWSKRDKVLANLFFSAELGSRAVGQVGFKSKFLSIKNRNVSKLVGAHSEYVKKVKLQ